MAKIGIRLADGKFYPILEDGQPVKKRLVVTTVKDDQASVQIDVYRKAEEDVSESSYIGSLIIENIPPGAKAARTSGWILGLTKMAT
jgi:molecular chaperone DnaK (HSP70)